MRAVIQADVRACDPPTLAVRVDEYIVAIAGPDMLGKLSRVDTIARETRQIGGGGEQVSIVAVCGIPAAAPAAPAVIHNLSVKQEPIAWVTVGPSQWEVRQEHIHTEWPLPTPTPARHPLELVSRLARQLDDSGDWDHLTPLQQSDLRMQARRAVQGMAKAGITEEEAAMLVRYYQAEEDE